MPDGGEFLVNKPLLLPSNAVKGRLRPAQRRDKITGWVARREIRENPRRDFLCRSFWETPKKDWPARRASL